VARPAHARRRGDHIVSLDHVPGVTLDRDADYSTLLPWRSARSTTAPHDDDGGRRVMEPTRRPPVSGPGWNDQAATALLVLVAGHLLAAEPTAGPLTPDRLARVVGVYHDLPALVAALADSPSAPVRQGAQQLRRLLRAGQAQVYQRVLPGLPVALADPFFRLDLARAACQAGLDLFPPTGPGG